MLSQREVESASKGKDMKRCASKDVGPRRGWIGGSHIDWRSERVPARTLGPEEGWIVRSHIGWGGVRNILYKGVEASPMQTRLKNHEGKPEKESPKWTISTSGGLGLLWTYWLCIWCFYVVWSIKCLMRLIKRNMSAWSTCWLSFHTVNGA